MNPAQAANFSLSNVGNVLPFFLYVLIAGIAALAVFCATLIWGIRRIVWWALKHSEAMFKQALDTQESATRSIEECGRAMRNVCDNLKDVRRSVDDQGKVLVALIERTTSEHTEQAKILRACLGALQQIFSHNGGHADKVGKKRRVA